MMTKPGGFGIIFLIYFHTGKGIGGNRNERESGSAVWSATGKTAGGRLGTDKSAGGGEQPATGRSAGSGLQPAADESAGSVQSARLWPADEPAGCIQSAGLRPADEPAGCIQPAGLRSADEPADV